MNTSHKNLLIQFLFLTCSSVYCKLYETNVYVFFVITFFFYVVTNYRVKDIHLTFEYLNALFLISAVYTLGMFVTTPLMVYGSVLKGCCSFLITFLNEKQITNATYSDIEESGLLETMSLEDAYFELEYKKLEDVYITFND